MAAQRTPPHSASWYDDAQPTNAGRRQRPSAAMVLAASGAALLLVLLICAALLLHRPPAPTTTLVYAASQTAQEVQPSGPPQDLLDKAQALAARGGGSVVFVGSAGAPGLSHGGPVSLRVTIDGEVESDAQVREAVVGKRLRDGFSQLAANPPTVPGRSLVGLLQAAAAARGAGPCEIWLSTFGMSTVAPQDDRTLTAADPGAAAAAIPAAALPDLSGVSVHVILTPAAGDQPALNAVTVSWRLAYVREVVRRTHALSVNVRQDNQAGPAWPDAPAAPPVENIRIPTPELPGPDVLTPPKLSLDTAAAFAPDSSELIGSRAALDRALEPFVKNSREYGSKFSVTAVGHCARFGDPQGARALSRARAEVIAAELRRLGVRVTVVRGDGFDNPPNPKDPTSPDNRVVVVSSHLEH